MVEAEQHPHHLAEDQPQVLLRLGRRLDEDYLREPARLCCPEGALDLAADVAKRSLYLLLVLIYPDLVSIAVPAVLRKLRGD